MMQPKSIKALAACLCLALVANACALPETSQVPGATLEQATMTECPTPTPQGIAMIKTADDSGGVAVQSAASPAEAVSGEAVELTAQQVLSREMMLDKVNAGPQRGRTAEGISEAPVPGTETQVDGDQSLETLPVDSTPTPCP